jgi:hypothetical protein
MATCSWPLDPVGPDAVDDGAVVTQLFDIRARVEDRGNTPLTGTTDFIPIAAVDPASVKVLILDDTSLPLVVDTSDPPDGICDDINPDLRAFGLAAIIQGRPTHRHGAPACQFRGRRFHAQPGLELFGQRTTAQPSGPVRHHLQYAAKNQVMTYLLGYAVNFACRAIWTIAPVVNDGLRCAGTPVRRFEQS